MRAVQLHDTDGLDALTVEEIARPEPDGEELLVRVHAAGVNPLDWLVCRGFLPHLLDEPLPWIPGWDVSGVVESVGTAVTDFQQGDSVYGMVRMPGAGGTFAEYATMRVEEVEPKPPALSHIEAAGVPMVGQTAYHALFEAADVKADTVGCKYAKIFATPVTNYVRNVTADSMRGSKRERFATPKIVGLCPFAFPPGKRPLCRATVTCPEVLNVERDRRV